MSEEVAKCKGCKQVLERPGPEQSASDVIMESLSSSHSRFKDHCATCGTRKRNILDRAGDLADWVKNLETEDPEAYSDLAQCGSSSQWALAWQ